MRAACAACVCVCVCVLCAHCSPSSLLPHAPPPAGISIVPSTEVVPAAADRCRHVTGYPPGSWLNYGADRAAGGRGRGAAADGA